MRKFVSGAAKVSLIVLAAGLAGSPALTQQASPPIARYTVDAGTTSGMMAMAERIPTLAGMSPWILKDFRSPRRQLAGVQDGWNRKGLIAETGEHKQAFDVLAAWYANHGR